MALMRENVIALALIVAGLIGLFIGTVFENAQLRAENARLTEELRLADERTECVIEELRIVRGLNK